MKNGTKVRFKPTNNPSEEFRAKIEALGDFVGEVLAVSNIGVCTVLLPKGVTIEGHSHYLRDGQHYCDIHEENLQVVA